MDYGSYLKQSAGNPNRTSSSYSRQSKFAGSRRQIRGQVIRLLADHAYTLSELGAAITDKRLDDVLDELLKEGLIHKAGQRFNL